MGDAGGAEGADPKSIFKRARFFFERSQFEETIKILEEWPHASCSLVQNLIGCAYMYSRLTTSVDKAHASFKRSFEIDPTNFEAVLNLGLVSLHLKQFKRAADFFQRVIDMTGGHDQAYYNLGWIFEHHLHKNTEAVNLYRLALDKSPRYALARESLERLGESTQGVNNKRNRD